MTHYEVDLCRVYFNSKADLRKLWSIDFGEGTEEFHFAAVWIVNVAGRTDTNLTADNASRPLAWIRFSHVVIDVEEDKDWAVIRRA